MRLDEVDNENERTMEARLACLQCEMISNPPRTTTSECASLFPITISSCAGKAMDTILLSSLPLYVPCTGKAWTQYSCPPSIVPRQAVLSPGVFFMRFEMGTKCGGCALVAQETLYILSNKSNVPISSHHPTSTAFASIPFRLIRNLPKKCSSDGPVSHAGRVRRVGAIR